MFGLKLEFTRKFTKDFNIEYIIDFLDRIDTGAELSVAVFDDEIEYEYFCVIALACLTTASAILISITNPACIFIRCRSPPVDSKRKILN